MMNIQSLLKQKNAANRPRDIGHDINKFLHSNLLFCYNVDLFVLTFYDDVFKEINMNRFKDH